jgi:hypothetical protein
MRYPNEKIEEFRRSTGELENDLIDEYNEGSLTRRELIQRGSVLGLSLPLLALLAGRPGSALAAPMRGVRRSSSPTRTPCSIRSSPRPGRRARDRSRGRSRSGRA